MAADPFESYLIRAAELFEAGDIVQAGQIWQAILKKVPDHEVARAGLYKVKLHFDARATQDGLAGVKTPKPSVPAPVAPAVPAPIPPDVARLLEQGCTLYDSGHTDDALRKWEQVLQSDPDNALAKGYINGARRSMGTAAEEGGANQGRGTVEIPSEVHEEPAAIRTAPEEAPQSEEAPVAPAVPESDVNAEKLLRDGCTLYDMGQVEDALKKWEKALVLEPGHVLIRSYAQGARKDLGLPPLEEGEVPQVIAAPEASPSTEGSPVSTDDESLEQLVRQGVQLFDMGMAQEAIQKWQLVLDAVPGHQDALAYIGMAKKDLESNRNPTAQPTPSGVKPQAAIPVNPHDLQLRQAQAWIQQGSYEEAAAAFQKMLNHDPKNAEALQGYQKARSLAMKANTPVQNRPEVSLAPGQKLELSQPSTPVPAPVTPPQAVMATPAAPARKGLDLPGPLQQMVLPKWASSPKFILGGIGALVVLIAGFVVFRQYQKEAQLKDNVASFSAQALVPVARSTEIPSLLETPESIRNEAEQAMGENVLLAYYRAQELVRVKPGDGTAAQLFERAKAAVASAAAGNSVSLKEYERQLQSGDLDAAAKTMVGLLQGSPDDADLKVRAGRLHVALAELFAAKERWQDAEDSLKQARAMFPGDKSWNARLKLLEQIRTMPRAERMQWIQLLG